MRVRSLLISMLVAPFAILSAQRSSAHGADFSIGVRFGSLGIGGEASKLITGHVGIRASVNYFKTSTTQSQSDIDFAADLKLHAVTALIDLYPGNRGAFHLSGGIITNPITVTAVGQPTGSSYKINGNVYPASTVGTLTGSGKFKSVSPYVGLGFGTPAASHAGLKLVFDLGVAIGKPTILLASTSSNTQVQSDVAAQQLKTQNDVNKYAKVYPVISMGLVARF